MKSPWKSKVGASCRHPSGFPPCAPSVAGMSAPPTPCEAGPEMPPHLQPPLPQTSHHQYLVPHNAILANSSDDMGAERGVYLRVRILNSLVLQLKNHGPRNPR